MADNSTPQIGGNPLNPDVNRSAKGDKDPSGHLPSLSATPVTPIIVKPEPAPHARGIASAKDADVQPPNLRPGPVPLPKSKPHIGSDINGPRFQTLEEAAPNAVYERYAGPGGNVANLKAFLHTIAYAEGPGREQPGKIDFKANVNDKPFSGDYSHHPNKPMPVPQYNVVSTAAGGFQDLYRTYAEKAHQLGIKDFTPQSQVTVNLQLVKECGAIPYLNKGDFEGALHACNGVWASLPGSPSGQKTVSMNTAKQQYLKRGGTATDAPRPNIRSAENHNIVQHTPNMNIHAIESSGFFSQLLSRFSSSAPTQIHVPTHHSRHRYSENRGYRGMLKTETGHVPAHSHVVKNESPAPKQEAQAGNGVKTPRHDSTLMHKSGVKQSLTFG